jgi:EAL domain-containing protein (putative c-di-GMP-specific phosphodiesterase class I)
MNCTRHLTQENSAECSTITEPPCSGTKGQPTVLIVDDDEQIVEIHRKLLMHAGFGAVAVTSALAALELLRRGDPFDAIVTDILMPDMDGVTLLREIRRYNQDVPVVLCTGNPAFDTAVEALQYGGFRYLTKPVTADRLISVITEAVSIHRLACLKREALTLLAAQQKQLGDRASLENHFDKALAQLWVAFQPIVDWKQRSLYAYEALMRSREPSLATPDLIIGAAERLGRVWELGRRVRGLLAARMPEIPSDILVFANLHPLDLEDPDLDSPMGGLSAFAPQIILEVTERSSLDEIRDVPERVRTLREMGYRLAIDDLGAGYAGLSSFSRLEPEVAKLDMSLIRGIDASTRMQSLVRSMLNVCNHELGIQVVCEGVETLAERDALESLGANLLQGHLFARAEYPLPAINW